MVQAEIRVHFDVPDHDHLALVRALRAGLHAEGEGHALHCPVVGKEGLEFLRLAFEGADGDLLDLQEGLGVQVGGEHLAGLQGELQLQRFALRQALASGPFDPVAFGLGVHQRAFQVGLLRRLGQLGGGHRLRGGLARERVQGPAGLAVEYLDDLGATDVHLGAELAGTAGVDGHREARFRRAEPHAHAEGAQRVQALDPAPGLQVLVEGVGEFPAGRRGRLGQQGRHGGEGGEQGGQHVGTSARQFGRGLQLKVSCTVPLTFWKPW